MKFNSIRNCNISLLDKVKGLVADKAKNEELKERLDRVNELERENECFRLKEEKISELEKSLEEKVKVYSDQIRQSKESGDVFKTRIRSLEKDNEALKDQAFDLKKEAGTMKYDYDSQSKFCVSL